jgi:beta-phosphoglucomutase-like phosphatase (HAD superfamily)
MNSHGELEPEFSLAGSTPAEVAEEILDDIISLSKSEGAIMRGVLPLLDLLDKREMKIGLATSSPRRIGDRLC